MFATCRFLCFPLQTLVFPHGSIWNDVEVPPFRLSFEAVYIHNGCKHLALFIHGATVLAQCSRIMILKTKHSAGQTVTGPNQPRDLSPSSCFTCRRPDGSPETSHTWNWLKYSHWKIPQPHNYGKYNGSKSNMVIDLVSRLWWMSQNVQISCFFSSKPELNCLSCLKPVWPSDCWCFLPCREIATLILRPQDHKHTRPRLISTSGLVSTWMKDCQVSLIIKFITTFVTLKQLYLRFSIHLITM